jgi:hypothetical protein
MHTRKTDAPPASPSLYRIEPLKKETLILPKPFAG